MKDGQYTPTLLQGYTRKSAKIRDRDTHYPHTHLHRHDRVTSLFQLLVPLWRVVGPGVWCKEEWGHCTSVSKEGEWLKWDQTQDLLTSQYKEGILFTTPSDIMVQRQGYCSKHLLTWLYKDKDNAFLHNNERKREREIQCRQRDIIKQNEPPPPTHTLPIIFSLHLLTAILVPSC